MILKDLEQQLRLVLKKANFEDATLEVRHLLMELLSIDGTALVLGSQTISGDDVLRAKQWAEKRVTGYPLAYLSGKKGFYKHDFKIGPGVLIPRPESELVVEVSLARIQSLDLSVKHVVDLGSGSGCIGLSVLGEIEGAILWSVDAAELANSFSCANAKELGFASSVQIISSMVESWHPPVLMDVVLANPPSIAEGDSRVESGVNLFEPHAALYSGQDGLLAIRSWLNWTSKNLKSGGLVVFEIGSGQSILVREIMIENGFEQVEIANDLAGHDRVVSAVKIK